MSNILRIYCHWNLHYHSLSAFNIRLFIFPFSKPKITYNLLSLTTNDKLEIPLFEINTQKLSKWP